MSLPVTEDTPPDMLAGSMDLNVVLPNGKNVKMSIQRSTPMMDLLVQVTTAHRLSPGNHALQAMGDRGVLPYKPSTPIGTLDAFTIKIVDKKLNSYKKAPRIPQTFLNTFRLQVNLPRSQLFVTRVTSDVTLAEILTHICTEKNLDINKYEFRNPGNPEEVLELDKTLGYYKIQELSLINKNNRTVGGLLSSADILHVKSSKHRQNSVCDSSLSSGSLGSRSTSPVPVNLPRVPPQPPIRKKRRPAPKPPQGIKDENKEETKTARSVLISHSRESSDSSGYHEASVLSESPTHNVPLGRSDSNSPPDTLPRHSKLLPSQSFTNLTTIQPVSRTRLASSISNASLNSNGTSRKKRPPPPPPISIQSTAEEKMKSSTLPTSRAEERIVSNVPFVSAENGTELPDVEFPNIKSANTKVENLENTVESEPKLNPQTKVDVEIDKSEAKSVVDVTNKPIPKPRKLVPQNENENESEKEKEKEQTPYKGDRKFSITRSQTDSALFSKINSYKDFATLGGWTSIDHTDGAADAERKAIGEVARARTESNDHLINVKSASKINYGGGDDIAQKISCLERWRNIDSLACLNEDDAKATKTAWLLGDSEASGETSPTRDFELNEHDSLNWQYQLPPPPTDFRDTNSPNCTEFGTITITPDIYKEEAGHGKEPDETDLPKKDDKLNLKDCKKILAVQQEQVVPAPTQNDEVRLSQKKLAVMGELTNVLTDGWKIKEKSSSISNLCMNESSHFGKGSSLSYSKSFSNELPTHMRNLKISALGSENNRNDKYESNIKYKNYKNLEKSLSMDCIRIRFQDDYEHKADEGFRRPVAPVQKKLKLAKRSSSTMGMNNITIKRKSDSDIDFDTDPDNIAILRQHFLEFLKEKNLSNDLSMKSLNVIRHILPKINGQIDSETMSNKIENNDGDHNKVPKSGLVKVIDFKKKGSALMNRDIKENVMIIEKKISQDEIKKEPEAEEKIKTKPELRRVEPVKRYSYHAPPSINFATWGERPKTQVFIKDEDYVTEEKVTKKMERKSAEETQKPIAVKKPGILQFKKPGIKSRYEMFSALPRKKEVTSLSLIQMEDEEKKKKKMEEEKEPSRMPVVCGMELKKEFKQHGSQPLSITEVTIKPEVKPTHSVSIYINGNQRNDSSNKQIVTGDANPAVSNFNLQKRSCTIMPVVKGFRTVNESNFHSHVNINKICNINSSSINNNSSNVNINFDGKNESGMIKNQKLRHVPQVILPPSLPPPPPPASLVSLKPVLARQPKSKFESQDQRDQLMREIRNFAGFSSRKLRTA